MAEPITDNQIINEFNEALEEYKEWVEKDFEYNSGWDEENSYIIWQRDELFALMQLADARSVTLDEESRQEMREIDEKFIKQSIKTRNKSHPYIPPKRDTQPKYKWWFWLDEFNSLDEVSSF